jgi:hypothetical protein
MNTRSKAAASLSINVTKNASSRSNSEIVSAVVLPLSSKNVLGLRSKAVSSNSVLNKKIAPVPKISQSTKEKTLLTPKKNTLASSKIKKQPFNTHPKVTNKNPKPLSSALFDKPRTPEKQQPKNASNRNQKTGILTPTLTTKQQFSSRERRPFNNSPKIVNDNTKPLSSPVHHESHAKDKKQKPSPTPTKQPFNNSPKIVKKSTKPLSCSNFSPSTCTVDVAESMNKGKNTSCDLVFILNF